MGATIYVWQLFIWLFLAAMYCVLVVLSFIALVCVWAAIVSRGWARWTYLVVATLFAAAPVYVFGFGWP